MVDNHETALPFRRTLVAYYDVEGLTEVQFQELHTKVMDLGIGIRMKFNVWDADQLKVTIREEPK